VGCRVADHTGERRGSFSSGVRRLWSLVESPDRSFGSMRGFASATTGPVSTRLGVAVPAVLALCGRALPDGSNRQGTLPLAALLAAPRAAEFPPRSRLVFTPPDRRKGGTISTSLRAATGMDCRPQPLEICQSATPADVPRGLVISVRRPDWEDILTGRIFFTSKSI